MPLSSYNHLWSLLGPGLQRVWNTSLLSPLRNHQESLYNVGPWLWSLVPCSRGAEMPLIVAENKQAGELKVSDLCCKYTQACSAWLPGWWSQRIEPHPEWELLLCSREGILGEGCVVVTGRAHIVVIRKLGSQFSSAMYLLLGVWKVIYPLLISFFEMAKSHCLSVS